MSIHYCTIYTTGTNCNSYFILLVLIVIHILYYWYQLKFYYTVGPLYKGHIGTLIPVLITEVSSIQRSLNTLQYYAGTQNGVLVIEVSAFQRFVIEGFHCTTNGNSSSNIMLLVVIGYSGGNWHRKFVILP